MTQPQSGAPQHEVFPNAPLQLVAVEVTYGYNFQIYSY